MDLGLEGKIAVITGAGRGIGRAIALALAREGCRVACITKSSDKLAETLAELPKKDAPLGFQADVADSSAMENVFRSLHEKTGRIDIIVNNAGIMIPPKLIFQTPEFEWDEVMRVNLKGYYNVLRVGVKYLLKNKRGKILNITSVLGETGAPGLSAYSASKSGIIGLTKSVARELAKRNITCNAIAPGYIITDINSTLTDAVREKLLSDVAMGKPAHPEEVAHMAAFLVSEKANYITGQIFNVDGGLVI